MIFVLNVKTQKNELFVVTRFFIVKNATEYELSIITIPIKKIDKKNMLYYYENKEKVLRKQKERQECDKKEFNRKQRERYHKEKVEKILIRFESMEIEVVG